MHCKDSLRDLESLRFVSTNEPHVLALREHLRKKIAEIENADSVEQTYGMAA